MKTTLIIETDDYANLDKILDSFRMIEGVKKVECMEGSFPTMAHDELKVDTLKQVPVIPRTLEEVKDVLLQIEAEHDPEKSIPHDIAMQAIRKRIQGWK